MHMQKTLLKGTAALMLLAALLAAVAFAIYEPNAQAATTSKGKFQLDLVVSVPKDTSVERVVSNIGSSGLDGTGRRTYNVDSFFDVFYISNIGSSGEDGVRSFSANFDVFFEIDLDPVSKGVGTEMISMSLTGTLNDPSNPGVVIDGVREALSGADPSAKGSVHYGHVTVLK